MVGLVKKCFTINLIILRILGLYPPLRYKRLYRIHAYMMHVCLVFPIPVFASIYILVQESITLEEISDSAFLICQFGSFIIKLLPFIINADQIRKCIYMIESSIFLSYTQKQEKFINECIRICRRNSWIFLSFCTISLIFWGIKPLFWTGYQLPIPVWLPFEFDKKAVIFYPTYIFFVLAAGQCAISNGVLDPLVACLAQCATTQLKILKDNLQFLGDFAEEEISTNYANVGPEEKQHLKAQIIYNKIKFCIKHHNAILEFVEMFEDTFSPVVFIQFSTSVLVICVSCLEISVVPVGSITFLAMFCFLITIFSEIYFYCYYGTTLYEENNTLTDAIFMGQWYDYDEKSKKALIVLMEYSNKPIIITAGKILDLSLVTFTTILRRAYSLLAVLENYKQ